MHHGGWGVGMMVERAQSAEWPLLLAVSLERLRLRCAPALSRSLGFGAVRIAALAWRCRLFTRVESHNAFGSLSAKRPTRESAIEPAQQPQASPRYGRQQAAYTLIGIVQ
ncbi:hypothetical protein CBM2605_B70170 [Cupriavidus neocaledonicus]|uniref:Transposase n=1 Tax=Cupriavidus neocaledonicus TaxID=1040979 RepID=A0ABY1VCI7_9BURK|nr:hypothetical protein CBM2605_B70170 [Cupriavidus neocaledonicus]